MNFINLIWIIPLAIIVSFLINHLADSLPAQRKLIFSPVCLKCNQTVNFSTFFLFRNCPNCHEPPRKRRFFVLIAIIITYVLLYLFPPKFAGATFAIIILSFLTLVFVIDFEYRLILHPVMVFGGILFLIFGIILNGWNNTLLGGGAGFLLMYILYLLGILFTKWISKRRGETVEEVALGYGDVNFSAILGLLFGWPRIAVLLFFAIMLGGFFSLIFIIILKILKKYEILIPIPYAPFLILSSIIMLYISTPK